MGRQKMLARRRHGQNSKQNYTNQAAASIAPEVKRRRSERIWKNDKPTKDYNGKKISQEESPVVILSDSDDNADANDPKKETGKSKKTTESTQAYSVPISIPPAATLEQLKKIKKFVGHRRPYWPTLGRLNVGGVTLADIFSRWCSPVWKRFFFISQNLYEELVYEFFSTYRLNLNTQDVTSKSAMSFSLCGKKFNLSFSDFAVAMKLYTADEVESESFKSGITDWPADASSENFWSTFGSGKFTNNISDTHIVSPVYRILHRAVAETINQRVTCTNLVNSEDLFYMYCIVNNKPCNLAKCLGKFLYECMLKSDGSRMCGGAFITQLAIGLMVVNEEDLKRLKLIGYTKLIEEDHLTKKEIVEKDAPLRFVGNTEKQQNNAQKDTTRSATQPPSDSPLEPQEKPKAKQQMPATNKRKTRGSTVYEALRKQRIKENKEKLESLGLQHMGKGCKSRKGKEEVDRSDPDDEYMPTSDSENEVMFDADEEPSSRNDDPNPEVLKRKRGRPRKTTSTTEASAIPLSVKPAATLEQLQKKVKFVGPRTLCWPTLQKLNVADVFNGWCTPAWKRLFDTCQNVYKPLVNEFFSTYRFNGHTDDVKSKSAMSFTLGGKNYNLSFSEFAVFMKLYNDEEVAGDEFKYGLTGWPSDVLAGEFWKSIGTGEYTKNTSATHIPSPSCRILHRAIAETINQRGSCTHLVTHDDLFYMYCIIKNKSCNVARCLAKFLYKGPGKCVNSAVCGGAYVTQLAIGLGVVTQEDLNGMEVVGNTKFFDEQQLRKLEIVEKDDPLRFVDPTKKTASDSQSQSTTHATLASQIQWSNDALFFLINRLGYSFPPPPHRVPVGDRSDGTPQAANDEDEAI